LRQKAADFQIGVRARLGSTGQLEQKLIAEHDCAIPRLEPQRHGLRIERRRNEVVQFGRRPTSQFAQLPFEAAPLKHQIEQGPGRRTVERGIVQHPRLLRRFFLER